MEWSGTIRQEKRNIFFVPYLTRPHVFRRTVGTDMINKGAPAEIVKEALGHVKIDTTLKCYAAISRETVQQAHARFVG